MLYQFKDDGFFYGDNPLSEPELVKRINMLTDEMGSELVPVEPVRRYVQVGSEYGEPIMEDMLIVIVDDWPDRPKGDD